MATAVETPIRAYQAAGADGSQFAVVEWIVEGDEDLHISSHDDSGDTTPLFLCDDLELVIRRGREGNLVCDLSMILIDEVTEEEVGSERIATIPFVIRAPEAWPDEWTDYLS